MQNLRILVCDDEPLLRDLIASHLCMSGFTVLEAYDGEQCLQQVEEQLPDAILLDVNMPKMNGVNVLKKLRAMGVKCPVILISATTDRDKIDEAHALGVQGFLPKPFNLTSINFAIQKCFPNWGKA